MSAWFPALLAGCLLACNAIVGVSDVHLGSNIGNGNDGSSGGDDGGGGNPTDDGGGGNPDDSSVTPAPPALQIVGGFDHTCAKSKSGTLKCWGSDALGQVGNGVELYPDGNAPPNTVTPSSVVGLGNDLVGVGNGLSHACAIKSDRTLVCWGYNYYGQLGDGKKEPQTATPVVVAGVSNVIQVAGGITFTCAIVSSGNVKCWGDNTHGQLGNGGNAATTSIVDVKGLSDAVEIAVGSYHACVLRSGGTVSCWGLNSAGQLGNGNTMDQYIPVDVGSVSQGMHITAGFNFSCAVKSSGQILCWGGNDYGQLGNGSSSASPTPNAVTVSNFSDAISIGAGTNHACAVHKTGSVSCWGLNDDGQLGNGMKSATAGTPTATPVSVVGLSNAVSMGQILGVHSCAANTNGVVLCWGSNYNSELAEDSTMQHEYSPVGVSGFP